MIYVDGRADQPLGVNGYETLSSRAVRSRQPAAYSAGSINPACSWILRSCSAGILTCRRS